VDLYALPPEEFTAARDAAAKADKGLKQLRRPTVSAWLVNTLVRRDAGLVEDLLDLRRDLGQAQRGQDATALRTLTEQRRQVVAAAVERAVTLAGRDVSGAVRAEVAGTLEAALSDPASGDAVRSGRLVRPLTYAGFGGVDLGGAVADVPGAPPEAGRSRAHGSKTDPPKVRQPEGQPRNRPKTTRPQVSQPKPLRPDPRLEQAALAAAGALDDAVQRADTAARTAEQAEQQAAAAVQQLTDSQAAVSAAERGLVAAREAVREAARRRTAEHRKATAARTQAGAAHDAVADAQGQADAARQALDRARRAEAGPG